MTVGVRCGQLFLEPFVVLVAGRVLREAYNMYHGYTEIKHNVPFTIGGMSIH